MLQSAVSASTGIVAVKIRYGSACSRVVWPSSSRFRAVLAGVLSSLASRRRLPVLAALWRDERAAIVVRFGSASTRWQGKNSVYARDAATIAKNHTEACCRACRTDAGAPQANIGRPVGPFHFGMPIIRTRPQLLVSFDSSSRHHTRRAGLSNVHVGLHRDCCFDGGHVANRHLVASSTSSSASDAGHCITRDDGTDALMMRPAREADFGASQVNGPSRSQ
ncbi:hypothetical protein Purlil1_12913 [Purpureocillium lilacinum]|uniref:Uncharacterized protein n=1 Tax=Purpureocillium lilacinum TaxID=33203 RepID=A0ABR0BFJ0_PURLI|nr:hypothetical protein Purlil1_12913 [Purpureocillium lilacinum]